MRLAYFSPLGPQRSGISDYSEELLPHLAEGAEVTLFVDGFRPSNAALASRFDVRDYRRDPSALGRLGGFDAAVYHVGNDHRYHAGILEAMRAHAGVAVFHDFALQDFFLGLARERGDMRVYLDEVAACHGEEARRLAAESFAAGGTPSMLARPTDFPLNCRLARAAEGLVVHSEWARSRFGRIAPSVPSAHIQMPVVAPRFAKRHEAQHGAGRDAQDGEVKIASFGLITPGKGIEHALRALAGLKGTHRFRYTLVGEPSPFFDVRGLVREYGMGDRVEITGHVTLPEFERRISETDIALNIRERTVGETSASLCRIMAAGVAAVVSRAGWYAELPEDCVVKVDLDETADAMLSAYLQRLIEDAPLRARLGENARRHALAEHDAARSAARYLDFIGEVIARRARRSFVGSVSRELAALGLGEGDEELLRGVALEVAALAPEPLAASKAASKENGASNSNSHGNNGRAKEEAAEVAAPSPGRLPKVEGVDYRRAAVEYLGRLSEERRHHLRTKPFYNLAHRPERYKKGEGMDEDTHRHFCDFANMAVALALPAGSRLLDVGCGSGWLSEYFARLGYEVCGVDISPGLVEMARERVARVPYGVDHETPLRCEFRVHDIEREPPPEESGKFDAVVCYDSLHHFEDERAVMRHLSAALPVGGLLFILEGRRPDAGSGNEELLYGVMREFETLESPFDYEYLRGLLDEHGFAVVGDYVSVNGLFERETLEAGRLPLTSQATDYHYLTCKKVSEGGPASAVPDSRRPGLLLARFTREGGPASGARLAAGERVVLPLRVENGGDTLWLTGQTPRPGVVMPAVRVFDEAGQLVSEFHGEPLLPRAVAPGEAVRIRVEYAAPRRAGAYRLKLDLVDQHVCWFESHGSEPFVFEFTVE